MGAGGTTCDKNFEVHGRLPAQPNIENGEIVLISRFVGTVEVRRAQRSMDRSASPCPRLVPQGGYGRQRNYADQISKTFVATIIGMSSSLGHLILHLHDLPNTVADENIMDFVTNNGTARGRELASGLRNEVAGLF